jgi:tetratricopeptide (TPR) repeat protein
VISRSRLYELAAERTSSGGVRAAALVSAARRAGASEVVEGELLPQSGGGTRLALRVVHLPSGAVRHADVIAGDDPFALAGGAAASVARGDDVPVLGAAPLRRPNLVALRLYDEGLRADVEGDQVAARRLYDAALRHDSTLALAAYRLFAIDRFVRPDSAQLHLALADRFSALLPAHDRRVIRAWRARATSAPVFLAIAESLAADYPSELEGQYLLGLALVTTSGDFVRAARQFERLIAIGSATRRRVPSSLLDAAFAELVFAYSLADSGHLSERAARRWLDFDSGSIAARSTVAHFLASRGRIDSALALHPSAAEVGPDYRAATRLRAIAALFADDFARADSVLHPELSSSNRTLRDDARWLLCISLRHQGRHAEVLRLTRMWRRQARDEGITPHSADVPWALAQAVALMEGGRGREAAALFDSLAAGSPGHYAGTPFGPAAGIIADRKAWFLTHAGTALALAGDTVRLARLADSVAALGARTAIGRDARLAHYLRGLLLAARGDHEGARAAYERAIWSRRDGYTRINLALARSLLALGRPREAAATLQAALRGGMEASSFYVTHTELHEALARAFEAAGEPDSARAHRAYVARTWARADPALRARRREAARMAGA